MKRTIKLLYLLSIASLISCSTKDLMKYYYPTLDTSTSKVYKYINSADSTLNEYWKVTYNHKDKKLTTESFRSDLTLYNKFEEEIVMNSAELSRYTDYKNGKEIYSTVNKTAVYSDNNKTEYSYSVAYTNKWGRFNFEKVRRFEALENITIKGITYKTAKFKDKYFTKAIDQNVEYDYNQTTYYAKDIGMVKYERFIPTGEVRILELDSIISVEAFDERRMKVGR